MININYAPNIDNNPYRLGSLKHEIWNACLAEGEFTKERFGEIVLETKKRVEATSKMNDETLQRAWWGEFHSKHKVISAVQIETTE